MERYCLVPFCPHSVLEASCQCCFCCCRSGFRIGEPNGGRRRTQRKVPADRRTTLTPPHAVVSPWTQKRSHGASYSASRRRNANKSGSCWNPTPSSCLLSCCTRPARTVTCLRAPTTSLHNAASQHPAHTCTNSTTTPTMTHIHTPGTWPCVPALISHHLPPYTSLTPSAWRVYSLTPVPKGSRHHFLLIFLKHLSWVKVTSCYIPSRSLWDFSSHRKTLTAHTHSLQTTHTALRLKDQKVTSFPLEHSTNTPYSACTRRSCSRRKRRRKALTSRERKWKSKKLSTFMPFQQVTFYSLQEKLLF